MTGDVTSRRLDVELVQRGLAPSRAQAREAIETGKVTVNGVLATKAGQVVSDGALIEAIPLHMVTASSLMP